MQQALKVIKGTDGVVTQHLVELLGNGVSLPGKDEGPNELRARAFQPWPSSSQHTHTHSLPWEVPTGPLGQGQVDSQDEGMWGWGEGRFQAGQPGAQKPRTKSLRPSSDLCPSPQTEPQLALKLDLTICICLPLKSIFLPGEFHRQRSQVD